MHPLRYIHLILLCAVLALTGCTGNGTSSRGSEADSIYTWENIRQSMMEEPEHALRLVDTAEMRGLADVNQANWMRASIYYNSPKVEDFDKSRDYCLKVLNNQHPEADSVQKQKVLIQLVFISTKSPDTYQDAVRYAMKGAEMAHHAGDILQEANFYFEAGKVMERLQQGSGIDYMNRSLDIYREAARDSIQPLPMLSSNLGKTARIFAEQKIYAAAIPLLQERLQTIIRIEKEYTTAPAGWTDQQRAYTYTVLAYCQYMNGDKESARRSAEAFEQTQAAQIPDNQLDMLNYYAIAGNALRIQQIYDRVEPYYREKQDTLSQSYANLLNSYAMGLDNIGRGHEAYQCLDRYKVINDSLVQRERQAGTLKYAQQMKTQEKELQLKDEEAKTRMQRVMLVGAVLIILLIAYLFVRARLYNKVLAEKNRSLYEQIQQREQAEAEECASQFARDDLTANQQLYRRLCELMKNPEVYTDAETNHETLVRLLGTNQTYLYNALRECAGITPAEFLNLYRVRHAAHLLTTTDDSVGLIIEMCGITNRSTFNRLFREHYSMSPSEYRNAARADVSNTLGKDRK